MNDIWTFYKHDLGSRQNFFGQTWAFGSTKIVQNKFALEVQVGTVHKCDETRNRAVISHQFMMLLDPYIPQSLRPSKNICLGGEGIPVKTTLLPTRFQIMQTSSFFRWPAPHLWLFSFSRDPLWQSNAVLGGPKRQHNAIPHTTSLYTCACKFCTIIKWLNSIPDIYIIYEASFRHHSGTTSVFEVVKQVPGSFRYERWP